nr:P3 [Ashitaba mosaic virus]
GGVDFRVTADCLKTLIRAIYRPKLMEKILMDEPYIIVLSILSPGVLMALANSGSLEKGTRMWIRKDEQLARMFATIFTLAGKMTLSRTLDAQLADIRNHSDILHDEVIHGFRTELSYHVALQTLTVLANKKTADKSLTEFGFSNLADRTTAMLEKSYMLDLEASWHDLSLLGKLRAMKDAYVWRKNSTEYFVPSKSADLKGRYTISLNSCFTRARNRLISSIKTNATAVQRRAVRAAIASITGSLSTIGRHLPELFAFANIMIIFSVLMDILLKAKMIVKDRLETKRQLKQLEHEQKAEKLIILHSKTNGGEMTYQEFVDFVADMHPDLLETLYLLSGNLVQEQ